MAIPYAQMRHRNIGRIWNDIYPVNMHFGDIRSIEEKLAMPDALSGDRKIDEAQLIAMQKVFITIDQMVDYFREGISVYLVRVEDSVKIMDAILDHTSHWRNVLETQLNAPEAPVADLIEMENFAAAIYDIAKHYIAKIGRMDELMRRLNSGVKMYKRPLTRTSLRGDQTFARPKRLTVEQVEEKEYKPNIDAFRQAMMDAKVNEDGPGRH